MCNKKRCEAIMKDLDERGLTPAAMTVSDEDGKLMVIGYDDKGTVNFINSTKYNAMRVYGVLNKGGMHMLCSTGRPLEHTDS